MSEKKAFLSGPLTTSGLSFVFSPSVSYDEGSINASAEGVNIFTSLHLSRDEEGRLKISNASCDAVITKMRARFSGTLGYLTLNGASSESVMGDVLDLMDV